MGIVLRKPSAQQSWLCDACFFIEFTMFSLSLSKNPSIFVTEEQIVTLERLRSALAGVAQWLSAGV